MWEKTEIKNCNFHRCNNIQKYRNSYFYELHQNNDSAKKIYPNIRAICFIDPKYTLFCLNSLSKEIKNAKLIDFIKYYKNTYAIDYHTIVRSNYYNIDTIHRTNNIAEGNNHKLNELFNKKPSTIRLFYELRKEEGFLKALYNKIEAKEYFGRRKYLKECDKDIFIIKTVKKKLKN